MGGSKKAKVKKPKGTEQRMEAFVGETKEDAQTLAQEAARIGQELQAKVQSIGGDYLAGVGAQERTILARLAEANTWLDSQTKQLSNNFASEIESYMADIDDALSLLSDQERGEMESKISTWTDKAYQLDEQLRGEVGQAMDRFETDTAATTSDFLDTTSSLGDRFLTAAQRAQDQYSGLMDEVTDPGKTMDLFDNLSKRALETRMDLLATADPRAMELSQIADNNAAALMSGQIGADVQANLARSSAMRALQGGFGASSEMGRGLAARDLGLTSLDLMRQGTQMYDAQRRLNFDTRISGIGETATSLTQENQRTRANQGANIFASQMDTAVSDRDQRLQAQDAAFRTRLSTIDARRGQDIATAFTLYGARSDREREALGLNMGVTQNFYNQARELEGLKFDTRTGLSRDIFNTAMNTTGTLYGTNVNAAGNVYSANMGALGAIYGTQVNAATNAADMEASARNTGFNAVAQARTAAAATIENAYQQAELRAAQRNSSSNSMWGTALGLGGSLLGGAAGLALSGGNPMGGMIGASIGGMAGGVGAQGLGGGAGMGAAQGMNMGMSAVGMYAGSGGTFGGGSGMRSNYTNLYGPATGGNTGLTTPTGWTNFGNYGV